ncbi:MAG: tetratricopeptide repeat protein [Mariprofundaceae bacterium]|nr:tetratricopeptide repeat protein [Mariprofundaceae bacterium]
MKLFIVALYISILSLSACNSLQKNTAQPVIHKQVVAQTTQPRSERSLYLGAQTAMRNGQPLLAIQFLKALLSQHSSSGENSLRPKLQLADLLLKSNHPNEALQYLQEAVQQTAINKENSPEQKSLYLMYARSLAGAQKYSDALDFLAKVLNQHPDFIVARHLQITLFVLTEQLPLAHIAINIAIQQHDSAKLHQFQADVFSREGKFQKASQSLKKMHALNPKDDTAILLLSQLELQQNHLDKAESILRDFNKLNPASLRVQHALARLLIQSKHPQEATVIYKQMLKSLPQSAEIQSALGLLYYQEKQFQKSADQFAKALQIAPKNQNFRFYLASSLEVLQKKKKARSLYQQIDAHHELWQEAQLRLASMDFMEKKYTSSRQYIQKVLKQDSTNNQAWILLSTIYLAQEKYQKLLDQTQSATALKQVPDRLYMNRAIAFEYFKRYKDVESTLKTLIHNNPNHADALNFLAYTYAEQGIKLDEAKKYIHRALAKKTDDGYYLDSLAWIYYKNGEYNKAATTQQKALKIINNDATMHDHLGDIFWQLDKKEKAIQQWQKALSLQPKEPALLHQKIKYGIQ